MAGDQQSTARRMEVLDAMRGIAAILVMFHHEAQIFGSSGLFSRAYLSVDFFFQLSGLVLALAFEKRMAAGLGANAFFQMRLKRLWPLMALGTVIGSITLLQHSSWETAAIVLALGLLLVPLGSNSGAIFPANGPIWSLWFELVANVAHAAILRRLSHRFLLAIIVMLGALLVILSLHFGKVGFGDIGSNWWGGFVRVGFSYTLGVWMGRRLATNLSPSRKAWWVPLLLLTAVLTLMPLVPLDTATGDLVAVTIALPLLLRFAVTVEVPAFASTAVKTGGALSYPLYVMHVPMLNLGAWFAATWGGQYHALIRPLTLILTIILAILLARSPLAAGIPSKLRSAQKPSVPSVAPAA